MTLEDVCHLVSPRRPDLIERILLSISGNDDTTMEDILRFVGGMVSEKTVRYYMTKLYDLGLLESHRSSQTTYYSLNPGAFEVEIKHRFVEPVRRLQKS